MHPTWQPSQRQPPHPGFDSQNKDEQKKKKKEKEAKSKEETEVTKLGW